MVSITLERLWMFSERIFDFQFCIKFHRSRPAIIFSFWTITEHVSYASKKLLIKPRLIRSLIKIVSITLERLWMFSERIVDFEIFVKFHRSGPAIIFSFWTIMENVSYASKKLLIKPRFIRTSSRWWVLLWKDYGCFVIELSIFNFLSNFPGSDLQQFSVFELSRSMLVMQQKSF